MLVTQSATVTEHVPAEPATAAEPAAPEPVPVAVPEPVVTEPVPTVEPVTSEEPEAQVTPMFTSSAPSLRILHNSACSPTPSALSLHLLPLSFCSIKLSPAVVTPCLFDVVSRQRRQ